MLRLRACASMSTPTRAFQIICSMQTVTSPKKEEEEEKEESWETAPCKSASHTQEVGKNAAAVGEAPNLLVGRREVVRKIQFTWMLCLMNLHQLLLFSLLSWTFSSLLPPHFHLKSKTRHCLKEKLGEICRIFSPLVLLFNLYFNSLR